MVEIELPAFSVSKLHGKASCHRYFAPNQRLTSNYLTGGWIDPRTGVEAVESKDISIRAGILTQVPL
jgi:hypothetical protein